MKKEMSNKEPKIEKNEASAPVKRINPKLISYSSKLEPLFHIWRKQMEHNDLAHEDSHADLHNDVTRINRHADVPHADGHGDAHGDSHGDSPHTDKGD